MATSGFLAAAAQGQVIFQSTAGSTAKAGDWIRVHPGLHRLAFQVVLQTASAGATAGTTVSIEGTNSTSYPALATKLQQFVPIATTDLVSDGGGLASSMDRQWAWIRANMISLTSSTAGSAGSPSVTVLASGGYTGVL